MSHERHASAGERAVSGGMVHVRFRAIHLCAMCLAIPPSSARGQVADAREEVAVTGTAPAAIAPSLAPLGATEPTSIGSQAAIEALLPPTANYDDALDLTPSVLAGTPDGSGLSEAATLTIRGFSDGQYNVVFDDIPFADTDDFTHHSSAYFVARDLGSITVDRGPGDGTTIGNATFGGTVSLASRAFDKDGSISPTVTLGSHETLFGGVLVQSGQNTLPCGMTGLLDIEGDESHGALDGGAQRRRTIFGKLLVPLGERTTLTLLTNVSRTRQGEPIGATKNEIALHGPRFALNDDPASQAYEGYNASVYTTDLSYAALAHSFASGASLTDTVYSYGLYRTIDQGLDPNGETPNGTPFGANDVPGQSGRNGLRAWGDILRATVPVERTLDVDGGLWIERQENLRFLLDTDRTDGDATVPDLAPVGGLANSAAFQRLQFERLVTLEPYVQLAWTPVHVLTLTAGLKGAWSQREVDAPVMEGTRLATYVTRDFGAPLPSFAAHLAITREWSAYAQAARGFLAPPLQFFDVANPATAAIDAETTWNFQAGTAWRDRRSSFAADIYDIVFGNAVGSRTVAGEAVDYDAGRVIYHGIEVEATRAIAAGFSLTGSASANHAHQFGTNGGASGPAPDLPQATLSGGVLFRHGALDAALIEHWTGGTYGGTGGTQWVDPFNELDLSLGATVRLPKVPPVQLRAQVFNLLDRSKIDGFAGYTAADATPLWWTEAGLTVFLGATTKF